MKTVYIKKDIKEKFNISSNRAWFVTVYRIVDETGLDLVQPWFDTKKELYSFIKEMGWKVEKDPGNSY